MEGAGAIWHWGYLAPCTLSESGQQKTRRFRAGLLREVSGASLNVGILVTRFWRIGKRFA